jgi:hypothetical protein
MKSTRPDSASRTAGVELFDVCHVGVVLRAALFVHAALAVGVLFEVQTLRGFALQFSLATAIALPAVLAWLIATCLLKNLIADIAASAQAAISATLGALCALGGRELAMQANPAGLEQLTALATAAAGAALALVIHQWLRMQALARTPADTAAQLAELQSRIRPHFLFNTLNSALALVRLDPQRAESVLEDLAELFRVALNSSDADVSLADANGARALHYCADQGDTKCALLLLSAGAEVDATDAHGNTALHAAGRRGHKALWATLLEANADAGALNSRGRTPKLLDKADADAACIVM